MKMMGKKKLVLAAVGATVVAASIFGSASAAFAILYHAGYPTLAKCVQAEGIWESHGYSIHFPCQTATGVTWYFATN